MQNKQFYKIGFWLSSLTVATVVAYQPNEAKALTTLGSFTFDTANSVSQGSVVQDTVSPFFANFPVDPTVGVILGYGSDGSATNRSVDLGDATTRAIIELTWGGKFLPNGAGEDLLIFESGNENEPEAFAVSIRPTGGSFTDFRYQFNNGFVQNPNLSPPAGFFGTRFDLSIFGLADGATIDAIRVMNLIESDRVNEASGQGFVNTGGTFVPLTSAGGTPFDSSKFDADITYAVGLQDITAIPFEFSSGWGLFALATLGGFELGWRHRRRKD